MAVGPPVAESASISILKRAAQFQVSIFSGGKRAPQFSIFKREQLSISDLAGSNSIFNSQFSAVVELSSQFSAGSSLDSV